MTRELNHDWHRDQHADQHEHHQLYHDIKVGVEAVTETQVGILLKHFIRLGHLDAQTLPQTLLQPDLEAWFALF